MRVVLAAVRRRDLLERPGRRLQPPNVGSELHLAECQRAAFQGDGGVDVAPLTQRHTLRVCGRAAARADLDAPEVHPAR